MDMTELTARLSSVIYPVMIAAGATWGATGNVSTGLAALALGLVGAVSLARWRPKASLTPR